MPTIVRHEGAQGGAICCSDISLRRRAAHEMEDRPSGAALQGEASNHLKLLWSRAMVVSVGEKVPLDGIR
jgi:hypothetical protein